MFIYEKLNVFALVERDTCVGYWAWFSGKIVFFS